MQENPSKTLPEALPPIRIDVSFSLIQFGTTILWSVGDGWLLYYYLPPEGKGQALVPLAFYGIVIFMAQAINALITPPIGYWSDHLHSRWGRRLPLMFLAALPLLIMFVLLWLPPIKGESILNLGYLAVILILFNVTQVLVSVPLGALLPELASMDRHRVRLTMFSASAQLLGVILAGLAGLLINRVGFFQAMLIYAIVLVPVMYVPFLTLRERAGRQIKDSQRFSFLESLKITLRNRAFLVLSATGICFWTASTLLIAIFPFIVTEVCLLSVADTPYFYITGVVTLLACYPLVTWLAGRIGKWNVFAGSLAASMIVLPGLMLIGPWFPIPLLAQGLIWIGLQSIAMSGITMLPQAFAAEIIDQDEKLTGQRREGAYYSAWSLLGQLIGGIAAAALPLLFLLGRSQVDVNGPLGVRLVGPIGGALMLVALLIFLRYPLRPHASKALRETGEKNES